MTTTQAPQALISGTVLRVGLEPDDVRGRPVNVVMLRQSSPGRGRTVTVPLTSTNSSLLKGLKPNDRILAGYHLGAGDSSHTSLEIDSLEKVPAGENMELVNAGTIEGERKSCVYTPFANKRGGMCDLTLVVEGEDRFLKVYSKLVDEAEETDDGDTLKVLFRVTSRPDGDGVVTTAVAVAIEVVS
jgi:hypothetical protein